MTIFIGRQRELGLLQSLPAHKANLVVLRGRRRIGKSRLVQEFAKDKRFLSFSGVVPHVGTTAQEQRDVFAAQCGSLFGMLPINFQDWSIGFSELTKHLTQESTVILLDEISWIGSQDPLFIEKLKNWWDLELLKFPNLTLILCGSVSTWIEKNVIRSTALYGCISLFLSLEELSLGESYALLKNLDYKGSDYDIFKILSITGGVPWYLEQISPKLLADENIKNLCFVKEGILVQEFNRIFNDLFEKRGEVYKKIVQILSEGNRTLAELRKALGYAHGGALNQYVQDLETAGFIRVNQLWSLKTKKAGKQSLYRLSDNYLRFYLKHIEPHLRNIHRDNFINQGVSVLPGWDTIMGLQFENLVFKNREKLIESIGIPPMDIVNEGPFLQKNTQQYRGCQIDYLIQTSTHNIVICEIKFSRGVIGSQVIDSVQEKIKRLRLPRGVGVCSVLLYVGELSEAIVDQRYFYRLIDVSEWMHPTKFQIK